MATIREVARRAGVSVATVSAVINGTKRVSDRLRAKVELAMRDLDYHPNALARALYKNRTYSLGFLVPSIANPGFSNALNGFENAARRRSYSVFVCNTGNDLDLVSEYRKRLIDMRVDGVALALTWAIARPDLAQTFRKHGVKVVGLSGGRPLPDIDCFLADEERGGYDLGRYLSGLGHRSFAFVAPRDSKVAELRLRGLRRAIRRDGGDLPATCFVETDAYNHDSGKEATLSLLAQDISFTCVVAFNDLMATGVLDALEDQGLTVPRHMSLGTFGAMYAGLTRPRLTTMVYDEESAGRLAAERLIERIEDQSDSPVEQNLIPMQLHIEASTRVP